MGRRVSGWLNGVDVPGIHRASVSSGTSNTKLTLKENYLCKLKLGFCMHPNQGIGRGTAAYRWENPSMRTTPVYQDSIAGGSTQLCSYNPTGLINSLEMLSSAATAFHIYTAYISYYFQPWNTDVVFYEQLSPDPHVEIYSASTRWKENEFMNTRDIDIGIKNWHLGTLDTPTEAWSCP